MNYLFSYFPHPFKGKRFIFDHHRSFIGNDFITCISKSITVLRSLPMKRFVFTAIAALFALSVTSQGFKHFTTVDGLSGTDVTAICENENYLWIATNDGLNSFDGKKFKTYRRESNSANSLTENNIETLMFDSKGLLWIGLKTGGVDIFNPRKNRFTHISEIVQDYPQRVISIYEDSKNNIWLGSWEDGLTQLEPTNEGELSYRAYKHYSQNIISDIIEKPIGKLWIGTYLGYFLYDLNSKKDIPIDRTKYAITQFLDTGEKNSLWFSTWTNGLHRLEWNERDFSTTGKEVVSEIKDVYRIFSSPDQENFYLGTWGDGAKKIEMHNGKTIIPLKANAPVILSFFQDRNKSLWMGTYGAGLYKLDNDNQAISSIPLIDKKGVSTIYTLHHFKNKYLLVGTQGDGLYLYDVEQNSLLPKEIKKSDNSFQKYILSLYSDDELLIVGNDDQGMMYASIDEDNTRFELKKFQMDAHFGKVSSIFRDSQSRFWIGTKQSGLVSVDYDKQSDVFTNYTHYDSFGMNEITGFSEKADGQLWVSSHSGIYLFNPLTKEAQRYGRGISDMVYCLAGDEKNSCLWLGTSVGLRKLNYLTGDSLENPFSYGMLPEGAARNVLLDGNDNLWFTIAHRIFCYIDDRQELREIDQGEFIKQMFFSSSCIEMNGRQHIVFGGTENLILIDPKIVLRQPHHTKILLTDLQIDHQTVDVDQKIYGNVILGEDTEYIRSLTLPYHCKWISLEFTEVGWGNFQINYQYQIKGFSENWQLFDISKPLTFSQLPPDDYILQIRSYSDVLTGNNDFLYSLKISVSPPWWRTKLFYFFLFTTILLLLYSIFLYIKNYYKKRQILRIEELEKKKKDELLLEKESFFAGLSHDLLTPFSLILAPVKDLMREQNMNEDQHEKLEIISKNATFLSDLFNTILDFKRAELIDEEIKEKNVELVSFILIVVNAFDYLAKSSQIELMYHPEIEQLHVSIDTIKLERILYNLIGNALKFTKEGGKVHVGLAYAPSANDLKIEIKDTGVGVSAQNQSKVFEKYFREGSHLKTKGLGLGLYTSKKFVRMMGGDIVLASEAEKGTTVTIHLPGKLSEDTGAAANEPEYFGTDGLYSILLVEDNDQLRDYLKKKLSAHFEVGVVSNGLEALHFIKNNLPEIVISDVMMPEMDGLTLCATIKHTPILSDTFVILFSAKSSTEDEMQGYKAGADFYIRKPFDPDALIKQLENVFATLQQRKKQIIADLFSPQNESGEIDVKDHFLQRAIQVIEDHLMDENFKIDEFAAEMNLSKTVLHRKFKLIVGETPNNFIRNVRLKKAARMLKETDLSVSEVAYLSGFNQAHYFIKCFKEVYQLTPKNYRLQNQGARN